MSINFHYKYLLLKLYPKTNIENQSEKSTKISYTLKKGGSFAAWRDILEAALVDKECAQLVFSDIPWLPYTLRPELPTAGHITAEGLGQYEERVVAWHKKDRIAYSIISSRLEDNIRPDFGTTRKTARELYKTVASTYRPIITVDIHNTIKALHTTRLVN